MSARREALESLKAREQQSAEAAAAAQRASEEAASREKAGFSVQRKVAVSPVRACTQACSGACTFACACAAIVLTDLDVDVLALVLLGLPLGERQREWIYVALACRALHAAVLRAFEADRVERLFAAGFVKCLCCTATLAWGVNFPARLVIVKGTEFYDRGALFLADEIPGEEETREGRQARREDLL